jgi:integrase
MQLSDKAIRALKPKEKPYKASDGQGLYILVTAQGSRLWRFDYRYQGKRLTLSLGKFPDVGLADARQRLSEARALLAQGTDPASIKKSGSSAANDNFSSLADDWLAKRRKEGLADTTLAKYRWFIKFVESDLGKLPARQIGTAEVLRALRRVEARGNHHSAKRFRANLSRIFKYGIASGRADRDPAADVSEALTSVPMKPRAAITTQGGLSKLLRAIDGYEGSKEVKLALQLLIHVFCRPGELRRMEWTEIDTARKLWLIPGEKMKMRQAHTVPLSLQTLSLLESLRILTGDGTYCFPSIRTRARPMSENTLNAALRRLGYTKEEMCSHGFRSTASTLLNESGLFNPDAIEAQLAHRPRGGKVRSAYMRGEFFDERVKMMDWWSNYLDGLAGQGAKTPAALISA